MQGVIFPIAQSSLSEIYSFFFSNISYTYGLNAGDEIKSDVVYMYSVISVIPKS